MALDIQEHKSLPQDTDRLVKQRAEDKLLNPEQRWLTQDPGMDKIRQLIQNNDLSRDVWNRVKSMLPNDLQQTLLTTEDHTLVVIEIIGRSGVNAPALVPAIQVLILDRKPYCCRQDEGDNIHNFCKLMEILGLVEIRMPSTRSSDEIELDEAGRPMLICSLRSSSEIILDSLTRTISKKFPYANAELADDQTSPNTNHAARDIYSAAGDIHIHNHPLPNENRPNQ
jgi:hypothetical protein